MHPCRENDIRRMALSKKLALHISFSEGESNGVYCGGTMVLLNTDTCTDASVLHSEAGATVVQTEWCGRKLRLGSVYAPVRPGARLAFVSRMKDWVTKDMVLGGDWNCVPDVTVDVQSANPLRYRNIAGTLLEQVLIDKKLFDFRR